MASTQVDVQLSYDEQGQLVGTIEPLTFVVGWVVTDPDGNVVTCGPKTELFMASNLGEGVIDGSD